MAGVLFTLQKISLLKKYSLCITIMHCNITDVVNNKFYIMLPCVFANVIH